MSEKEKILNRYFEQKKREEVYEKAINWYNQCRYYDFHPEKRYHFYQKETQMQKLWENTIGKIYDAICSFGTWCGRIITLPIR